MDPIEGGFMPSYDIVYLNEDGSLGFKLAAQAASDAHAKVLAHAMKLREFRRMEVWNERTCVYRRPGGQQESAV
jgi:hypothetical protein